MRSVAATALACLAIAPLFTAGEDTGYVEPAACAPCHQQIYDTYRRTGMGRSFYPAQPESTIEDYSRSNTYHHEASAQHFTMLRRGDRFYQRRHQLDGNGREFNVVEKEIHFVLGSGNHVRSYLHLTPNRQLIQLPVAWYAEKGGFWAMNPGYDRPDHMDFRRKVNQECFFCHNAYPSIDAATAGSSDLYLQGAIPEGIDCQRCHGPGRLHVQSAKSGDIVNPARLTRQRQLELCLQCHLESTSRLLPHSMRRYGRGYFSYRPGEPLENYILHFDRAPQASRNDSFEIAHSGYRLMKSQCFLKSNGALTCTTCHDPHQTLRGEEATQRYVQICQGCHKPAAKHPQAVTEPRPKGAVLNCLPCHMPKRRTDDVVHVVMTDHYIQRHKPARDLLAPLSEQLDPNYRGEVVLFYPPRLPATSENELHLATAQVIDGANLIAGIPRLQKAIENHRPSRPAFYFELARAFAKSNQHHKAIEYYQAALRRKQDYAAARVHYAVSLQNLNRWTDAAAVLEPAVASVPVNAEVLNALGSTYLHLNRLNEAVAVLRRAATADADLPEIYLNLGTSLFKQGNHSEASQVLKEAIRARPGFAAAHNNLAAIFDAKGDSSQAEAHFQAAVRFDPTLTEAATRLGMLLAARGELPLAIELYRRVIQIKPDLAAHYHLALALLRLGNNAEAKPQLRIVIERDPDDYAAHFNLGTVLLNEGDYRSAMTHFEKASASPVPELRTRALNALRTAAEKLHR